MFLRDGICQSTKGDALPGYFVECVASNVAQAIYADANSTPIVSVSGVANRAKADVRGNYSYFVADGNYYEKYYDKQGVFQFQRGPFSMIGMDSVAEAAASAAAAAASAAASTNASNLTSGTVLAARMPALTGDVTTTVGTVATTIAGGAVTNAKLANVATATLKGRVTGGTGSPEDLTGTQATTLLDTFSSALKGLAPASGGGTTNFLRADGAWAAPPGGGGTTTNALTMNNGGAGAASGSTFDGSVARTISYNTIGATRSGAITSGDLSIATARLAGRTTAATGAIEEISVGATLTLSAGSLAVASVPNALTFNNGGAGAASGTAFNGAAAFTISYNTIGAAPLASPVFTGNPTAPTPAALDNDTSLATTAFVQSELMPSVQAVASAATFTPVAGVAGDDAGVITALAVNLTIAAPTGTPVQMQPLILRIKDNGTARTLTWNAIFRAIGVTLPTTTVISKTLYVGFLYNATDSKWDCVLVRQEA